MAARERLLAAQADLFAAYQQQQWAEYNGEDA
jgi:hypothetical protein